MRTPSRLRVRTVWAWLCVGLMPACVQTCTVPTVMTMELRLRSDSSAVLQLAASSVHELDRVVAVPGPIAPMRVDGDLQDELNVRGAPFVGRLRIWVEGVQAEVPDLNAFRIDDLRCRHEPGTEHARLVLHIPVGRHARWPLRYPVYSREQAEDLRSKRGKDAVVAGWQLKLVFPQGWTRTSERVTGLAPAHTHLMKRHDSASKAELDLASGLGEIEDTVIEWEVVYRKGEVASSSGE